MWVEQRRKQSLSGCFSSMLRMYKTSAIGILSEVFLCQIQQFKKMKIKSNSINYYPFNSCLRRYLLVKKPIRHPKAALKASPKTCAAHSRRLHVIQFTPNSIAGCAYRKCASGRSGSKTKPTRYHSSRQNSQTTHAFSAQRMGHKWMGRRKDGARVASELGLTHQLRQRQSQRLCNGMHFEQGHIVVTAFHPTYISAVRSCQQGQLFLRNTLPQTYAANGLVKGQQKRIAMMVAGKGWHPRSILNIRTYSHGVYPANCRSKFQTSKSR